MVKLQFVHVVAPTPVAGRVTAVILALAMVVVPFNVAGPLIVVVPFNVVGPLTVVVPFNVVVCPVAPRVNPPAESRVIPPVAESASPLVLGVNFNCM